MSESRLPQSYRVALLCGLLPLVSGTATYLLWLPTRWVVLEGLGALILLGGCACFIVGLFAVLHLLSFVGRGNGLRILGRSFLALVILVSNFPAAGTILHAVERERRGRVSPDWIKARAWDFHASDDTGWKEFPEEDYCGRIFEGKVLVLASNKPDQWAFAVLPDRTIRTYFGDSVSLDRKWLKSLKHPPDFSSWWDFRRYGVRARD